MHQVLLVTRCCAALMLTLLVAMQESLLQQPSSAWEAPCRGGCGHVVMRSDRRLRRLATTSARCCVTLLPGTCILGSCDPDDKCAATWQQPHGLVYRHPLLCCTYTQHCVCHKLHGVVLCLSLGTPGMLGSLLCLPDRSDYLTAALCMSAGVEHR